MLTKRSRNSYILSPRSVTVAPTFIPSRSLKAAIDFFALVTIGFCPEIVIKSLTAESMILAFWIASPKPMLMTIFSSFGTLIGFLWPNSLASAGATSFVYFSLSLAAITLFNHGAGLLRDADLALVLQNLIADADRAPALDEHHVRHVDRGFALDDAAGDSPLPVLTLVMFLHVPAFDQDFAFFGQDLNDAAPLAFVFSRDDHHLITFFYLHSCRHNRLFSETDLTVPRIQITSGARLTIFVKPRSRNSRATGPNTRVPTGSPSGLINTAAFWSKRM